MPETTKTQNSLLPKPTNGLEQKLVDGTLRVAKVVDDYTLVINAGANDGVAIGQAFMVFSVGDEIIDPITQENLGRLEVIKGYGKITHVQPRIATLTTSEKEEVKKRLGTFNSNLEVSSVLKPFSEPRDGDYLRPTGRGAGSPFLEAFLKFGQSLTTG